MDFADNGIHSDLSTNDPDDASYRRLLSHAFSEKAIHQHEHLLQLYMTLVIKRLCTCAVCPETAILDVVKWLSFTTFDIVGDIGLANPFHCLS